MKTQIQKQIEDTILNDLTNNIKPKDAEDVYKYRDANFLGGNYDHLFIKYIEQNNLH